MHPIKNLRNVWQITPPHARTVWLVALIIVFSLGVTAGGAL